MTKLNEVKMSGLSQCTAEKGIQMCRKIGVQEWIHQVRLLISRGILVTSLGCSGDHLPDSELHIYHPDQQLIMTYVPSDLLNHTLLLLF